MLRVMTENPSISHMKGWFTVAKKNAFETAEHSVRLYMLGCHPSQDAGKLVITRT